MVDTMVNAAKPYYPEVNEWFFRGIELSVLVSGVVFTTVCSNIMRKKRAAAGDYGPPRGTVSVTNCRSRNPYAAFDELISRLRSEGHDHVAQKLHEILHEAAWTTGSELMGELGLEILTFQRSARTLSPELEELLGRCLEVVNKAWPDIEETRGTPRE